MRVDLTDICSWYYRLPQDYSTPFQVDIHVSNVSTCRRLRFSHSMRNAGRITDQSDRYS